MTNWKLFQETFRDSSDDTRVWVSLLPIILREGIRCGIFLIVLLVLMYFGLVTLTGALIFLAFMAIFDVVTFSLYVKELIGSINFLGSLYANPYEPPPKPKVNEVLHRDLIDAGLKLHNHWMERERLQNEALFSRERVFDALPDPIFLLRGDGVVITANTASNRFFRRDLIGGEIASFLSDETLLRAVEQVVAGDASQVLTWSPPDTPALTFDVQIIRLPASEARTTSNIMVAMHDITAVKRLETMRADFVANASHELRTPLASLIGFTETLASVAQDDPEARERFLPIMLEQGQRMQRLVDDLLSLSRIEMLQQAAPANPVNLHEKIVSVTQALELRAREKGVELIVSADENLPPAMGEREQLTTVFRNLLDNALKYGPDNQPVKVDIRLLKNGPIRISGAPTQDCLVVRVQNGGDVLSADDVARLTERFYRADKARSRALGGNGLGLAIVKHVILRHRGDLKLRAFEDGGLEVSVFLPVFFGDADAISCYPAVYNLKQ